MYLTTLDILAVIIALVMSITFVITTGIANARLTASRDEWRKAYYDYQSWQDALNDAKEDRW
jgi:hypothetical protein